MFVHRTHVRSTVFPYTTLFRSAYEIYDLYQKRVDERVAKVKELLKQPMDFKTNATVEMRREKAPWPKDEGEADELWRGRDRKSTRLNSSHLGISYAVFCLKKKK